MALIKGITFKLISPKSGFGIKYIIVTAIGIKIDGRMISHL
jgi:hypothetical protein